MSSVFCSLKSEDEMGRRVALLSFCLVFLSGCSMAFFTRKCAEGPEESLALLFEALQSTDAISTDIEKPPMNLREILDLRKITHVAPDPLKLLATLGKGNSRKGWDELRFLRSLNVFHNASGLEFQEYKMTVARKTSLLPTEAGTVRYKVGLERVDVLLDMRDDKNFKEVRKTYSRTFIATFTESGHCIIGLTPIDEWASN